MVNAAVTEIGRMLQAGADALAEAVRGMDEANAALRPRPDSWSVVECVEHIALTEAGLLAQLKHFSYCCRALNGSLNHALASSAVSRGSK